MAYNASNPTGFLLPARIRARGPSHPDLGVNLDLIDRIVDLPDIDAVEHGEGLVPQQVDMYLRGPAARDLVRRGHPTLLCSFARDGLTIYGLDRGARHHILDRGWGGLSADRVVVYLPRDDKELEVVWRIVKRAYENQRYSPGRVTNGSMSTETIETQVEYAATAKAAAIGI